jgi:hypothetical protein
MGEPIKCDQNLGYYGVVVCMMGVQSFRENAYLRWDKANQKVIKA